MKPRNRIISLLLAAVMVITFALPVSAMEVDPVQDVIDMTNGTEIVFGGEDVPPAQDDNESADANAPPAEPDASLNDNGEADTSDDSEESDKSNTGDDADVSLGLSTPGTTESGNFLLDCTPEQAAELIAFYEFVKTQIARQSGIQLFSAPGDSGTVTWEWGEAVGIDVPSGDPGNPYHIGNIPRLTLNTANPPVGRPFCVEFGVDPGGSYTASQGSNSQILSLLVAFEKGSASAVGVQLALWYIENGLPLSSQPQAAAALSAASSVNTTGYTYLVWNSGSGQPFVTLDREESPTIPPTTPPEEEGNPNTHTEVTTETSTRTEVRSNTTYEYSDAIGQITIAKRDNEGKSLDGAIFNIQIEFANGERGGDSAFEVPCRLAHTRSGRWRPPPAIIPMARSFTRRSRKMPIWCGSRC